ncbi:MAG: hypothetical protein Ct9H300mP25_11830 [Acidobacteriota bacterium]|nr:MAG: hypothetical protein Ct9H300mP25_11830 [Acidobacteriota bacterium]
MISVSFVVLPNAMGPTAAPERPAAHVSIYLALLPSGPDAVRRLKLHRVRATVRPIATERTTSVRRHLLPIKTQTRFRLLDFITANVHSRRDV